MEPREGTAPSPSLYQREILLLNYRDLCMELTVGFAPTKEVLIPLAYKASPVDYLGTLANVMARIILLTVVSYYLP